MGFATMGLAYLAMLDNLPLKQRVAVTEHFIYP
jgi:hypothetical protein